jgi:uncharacterized protein (UPF0333 family)
MGMMKNGQISAEYLIVVGFIVFLVIVILGFAFFYASGTRDSIKVNQLSNYANKIVSNSEAVFYAGEPSRVTVTAYLPAGVQTISVYDNPAGGSDIVFTVETSSGNAVIAYTSDVRIDSLADLNPSEGVKRIQIVAEIDKVTLDDGLP